MRVLPWHDVPQPVRSAGSTAVILIALLIVFGLAAFGVLALVLHVAERGGL